MKYTQGDIVIVDGEWHNGPRAVAMVVNYGSTQCVLRILAHVPEDMTHDPQDERHRRPSYGEIEALPISRLEPVETKRILHHCPSQLKELINYHRKQKV